jgi:hypothetical protein
LLRPKLTNQPSHAREIAARSIQGGDQTGLDRIGADAEDDGDGGCCRLGGQRRSSGECTDHRHLTAYKIGRHRRHSIILTFRPAIFDRYVPTFDVAGLA